MQRRMTRTLAAALAITLAAAPLTQAQAAGSIRDAVTREATQLALAPSPQPSAQGTRGWAQLRALPPGESLDLTTREWYRTARIFIAADDASVVLLNTGVPGLPASAGRRLQDLAERAPQLLAGTTRGGTVVDERLRLSADGVFVDDRRVSSLAAVIEVRSRDDIDELAVYRRAGGFWGHLGPLGGYFVGALAGGYGAGLICQAARGKQGCDTGAFLTGMLAGGVAGASYGYHSGRRINRYTLYRAR
jgi:hypothetical protein